MISKNMFIIFSMFVCASIFGMEQEKQPDFYSIIMPGQNGLGGETFDENHVINTTKRTTYKTLTDDKLIDLGQENCIRHFQEQVEQDPELKNNPQVLLYGVSQGSATVINWLAQKSHEEQEKAVKCLFLEAVLGNGNSAIKHTAQSSFPITKSLLFPRFLLPLSAKAVVYPSYKPWGISAHSSAEKLSPKIPVIIMHHIDDFQLSIDDARKLYCIVRKNNRDNVYLFEVDNAMAHINILGVDSYEGRTKKIAALQAIYKKHGLPYAHYNEPIDLKEFQPSIEEVKSRK